MAKVGLISVEMPKAVLILCVVIVIWVACCEIGEAFRKYFDEK
ncbi:hypothetical protein [Fusibacter paucivorans]|nr:hypothetical protein [Fusibacter paucivorans]